MALNFGNSNSTTRHQGKAAQSDRAPSQYWANIGYVAVAQDQDGEEHEIFVSLNRGIALDDVERMDESSSNLEYAARSQASNGLLDDLLEAAKKLEPGESKIISSGDLSIQLRRVRDKNQSSISPENNPLRRKMSF